MRRAITIKEAREIANQTMKDAEDRRIAIAEQEADKHCQIVWRLREERGSIPITDTQILDWMADERVFDGINGLDIDEMTSDALRERGIFVGHLDDTEEAWTLEWRRQFRIAIMKGIQP